jgi:hypothetical protein
MSARFSFTSPRFSVEFRGSEEFVKEQIELVRGRIRECLRDGAGPKGPAKGSAAATAPGTGRSSLEEYYEKARTREGRGALQDSILIFAAYMHDHQGKHEFSIEDLNFCFDLLDIRRPKSLANTLGILKRDRQLLHGGSRRGTYALTEKGREKVNRLF